MRCSTQLVLSAAILAAGLTSCSLFKPRDTTGAAAAQGTPSAAPGGTAGTAPAALRTEPVDSPIATGAGGGSSGGASGGKAGGGGGAP